MSKVIEVDKKVSRERLEKVLAKAEAKKSPIDINKYFGKVNFGVDGLEYQLKSRDEWR